MPLLGSGFFQEYQKWGVQYTDTKIYLEKKVLSPAESNLCIISREQNGVIDT